MTTKGVPEDYFQQLLWPNYVKHNAPLISRPDILILVGEEDPGHVFNQVIEHLGGRQVQSQLAHLEGNVQTKSWGESFVSYFYNK